MFSKFSNEQSIQRSKLDWLIAGACALLAVIGCLIVISAVDGLGFSARVIRTQLLAVILAGGAFMFGWLFNYQVYNEQYKTLYACIIALLSAVLVFGVVQRGSNAWLSFGFFNPQTADN